MGFFGGFVVCFFFNLTILQKNYFSLWNFVSQIPGDLWSFTVRATSSGDAFPASPVPFCVKSTLLLS